VIPVWGVIGHRANELRDISSRVGTSTEILGAQVDAARRGPERESDRPRLQFAWRRRVRRAEVADQIRAARAKKPIDRGRNALMASAAYWIGSAASSSSSRRPARSDRSACSRFTRITRRSSRTSASTCR
jgi:hypothetical protein